MAACATGKKYIPHVLERLVFVLNNGEIYLVADAYDGKYIKDATETFLRYAAGGAEIDNALGAAGKSAPAGGKAQLLMYAGHNGLMDFLLDAYSADTDGKRREAAVFACKSKEYFSEPLEKTGATPLVLTANFMCPEAHTTHALVTDWVKGMKADVLRELTAQTYNQYQKCGVKGARRMFRG